MQRGLHGGVLKGKYRFTLWESMLKSPDIGSADVRAFAMLNMSNWNEYKEIKPIKSKRMIISIVIRGIMVISLEEQPWGGLSC